MTVDVVTGAEGFIGQALVKELLGNGHDVLGVGVNEDALRAVSLSGAYKYMVAPFERYTELAERVDESYEYGCFYHCAWAGGFTDAIKDYHLQMSNAAFAGDALNAAVSIGCKRFVQTGTYNEYEIATLLQASDAHPRLTCIYSVAKTAADVICRTLAERAEIEYAIGLVPMPYGEGNRSMQLVNVVLTQLMRGESPKLVEGNELYDIVHVSDVARGLISIGERGVSGRAYYVGHRVLQTFRSWMENTRDVVAPDVELLFGAYKDNHVIDYSQIDLDLLFNDTGFECSKDFVEGITETVAWLRKQDSIS